MSGALFFAKRTLGFFMVTMVGRQVKIGASGLRGIRIMVVRHPSKVETRVRFPHPAPNGTPSVSKSRIA